MTSLSCKFPVEGYVTPDGAFTVDPRRAALVPGERCERRSAAVDCGRCISCRLRKASDWGLRCSHEAKLHEANCFVTLTYADEFLPEFGSLEPRAFQRFMHRLRKSVWPVRVRFLGCGEYGEQFGRPHYHIALFGYRFEDLVRDRPSKSGKPQYSSARLSALWPVGECLVGDVTAESGGYIAGYIVKVPTGPGSERYYERVDPLTGEIGRVEPEFLRWSNRPSLGRDFAREFRSDWENEGCFRVKGGSRRPVPRSYVRQLRKDDAIADGEKHPFQLRAAERGEAERARRPEEYSALRRLEVDAVVHNRVDAFRRDGVG